MNHFKFTAFGDPAPQGSKRYVGNGRFIEASSKLKPWRSAVADAVFLELVKTGAEGQFTEPVVVDVTFRLPKPKTVKRLWPSIAPDLDKLQRALGDAMSVDASLLADDSLIVAWHSRKVYSEASLAGASVEVRLATEADMEKRHAE
jgi:Holliday junction resolvase RusA-like endonuclease